MRKNRRYDPCLFLREAFCTLRVRNRWLHVEVCTIDLVKVAQSNSRGVEESAVYDKDRLVHQCEQRKIAEDLHEHLIQQLVVLCFDLINEEREKIYHKQKAITRR